MNLTKGERVYLLRRRLGKSQEDVADNIGISHDTLSKIEKGVAPARLTAALLKGNSLLYRSRSVRPTKGELITVLRRRLGLTIAELALQFDLSKVTLMSREKDRGDTEYVLGFLREWVKRKQSPVYAIFGGYLPKGRKKRGP